MDNEVLRSADAIGMFCRLRMKLNNDLPIRSSEMGVLIYISKETTPATPLMISRFFSITKPSVTSILTALVDKGYLLKESSLHDRRSYTLKVTEKGEKLLSGTFDEYFRSVELLRRTMGEEKFRNFIELMEEANEILKEVD